MKGVILAGGKGTRLLPLTKVVNKHLLPVYDRPMVFFPVLTLAGCGIKEILLLSNPEYTGDLFTLLGHGERFGVKLSYAVQDRPDGIAHALSFAKSFVGNHQVAVILGDNVFFEYPISALQRFERKKRGGCVFLKQVSHPSHFGIVEFNRQKKIKMILEKPKKPPTNWAVVGLYLYNCGVFDVIERLKPSARGELEITDVNNFYAARGELSYEKLSKMWIDAGSSFESLYEAATMVKQFGL